jgi:hypothetical protein
MALQTSTTLLQQQPLYFYLQALLSIVKMIICESDSLNYNFFYHEFLLSFVYFVKFSFYIIILELQGMRAWRLLLDFSNSQDHLSVFCSVIQVINTGMMICHVNSRKYDEFQFLVSRDHKDHDPAIFQPLSTILTFRLETSCTSTINNRICIGYLCFFSMWRHDGGYRGEGISPTLTLVSDQELLFNDP